MTRYELDLSHEQADAIYRMARGNPDFGVTWAEEFKQNIPIPVPTDPGAVIRTGLGVYVLAACGNHWVSQFDVGGEHEFVATAGLGRITEVLSRGVPL